MRSRVIKKQLESLKEIRLSPEVKKRQRELLLSQIQAQLSQEYSSMQKAKKNVIFSWQVLRFTVPMLIFRPIGTIVMALLLIIGGSAASVSAAKSLPGDILYPVKIITERAQLTFTRSEETKAQLQIEFAERRIQELQEIAANPQRKDDHIEKTVSRAKKNFEDTQKALAVLRENEISQEDMLLIAKVIEEKSDQLNATVSSLQQDISQDVLVNDLLQEIGQTNVAALNTLVTNKEDGGFEDDELPVLAQERIQALNQKITNLETFITQYKKSIIKEEPAEEITDTESVKETVGESSGDQTEEELVKEDRGLQGEKAEKFISSGFNEKNVDQKAVSIESLVLSVQEIKNIVNEATQYLEEEKNEEALTLLAKGSQLILEAQKQADELTVFLDN